MLGSRLTKTWARRSLLFLQNLQRSSWIFWKSSPVSRSNMASRVFSQSKMLTQTYCFIERYRPLPVLEHRTFLLDIQLDLLIAYHRHIRGLVDQYESLTYSFVRVMPGATTDEELNTMGVAGLRTLSQWLASTEYISSTLKDWGEDVVRHSSTNVLVSHVPRLTYSRANI